jgi:hypothetical protein
MQPAEGVLPMMIMLKIPHLYGHEEIFKGITSKR